jgi:hypothetical protein
VARTILLFHIISARPSKQPRMVRAFLKVYMELGSYFLFLQEQIIKDTVISRDFPRGPEKHADLAECRLTKHPKTSGTLKGSEGNHSGSSKPWRHRHTVTQLSTKYQQTLRQHDAVRAAACWHPLWGGGKTRFLSLSPPPRPPL